MFATAPSSVYGGVSCQAELLDPASSMSAIHLDVLENFVFPERVAEANAVIFQQPGLCHCVDCHG
jgi:hypothetical protein